MDEASRAFDALLRTLGDPRVRYVATWAALAGIAADLVLAALSKRFAIGSLLGALGDRARGWAGTLAVGLLHPAVIVGASLALTLAATRSQTVLGLWWLSGTAIGAGLAIVAMIVMRPPRSLGRIMPLLLVGVAIGGAARWLAAA